MRSDWLTQPSVILCLRYLGLSHNLISDKSCEVLAQLLRDRTTPSVQFFTPQRHKQGAVLPPDTILTPQHLPLCHASCSLSKLLLAGNLLTDFGVALLSGALAENSNLESLSLGKTVSLLVCVINLLSHLQRTTHSETKPSSVWGRLYPRGTTSPSGVWTSRGLASRRKQR